MSVVKQYILEQVAANELTLQEAKEYLQELNNTGQMPKDFNREVAIIGMSGRFPKSDDANEFWEQLRDGINCIDEYPEHRRKDNEHILRNPSYMEYVIGDAVKPEDMGDVYAKAGYLKDTDKFDAGFFGIPPAEATYMDPSQRLILETAWNAMEDAGYGGKTLYGTNTGVYIGKEGTNFSLYRYNVKKDPMQLTGSWESIIASRISYLFNFKGPCMLVDTACSASLVSIHMAANAILQRECECAIAGGVNVIPGEFKPKYQGGMSMDSVESEDSIIRTFDAQANGTVWGEGVALVLLKSLTDAVRDGDHIHAIIKGSAINNDGASNGLTAPNAEAQEAVILKAWDNAKIHPETLSYVEAHGTGTVLGDPIEFKGLTRAFRQSTSKRQFCAIGSLKTNMGHLVASSGVASLFKVVKSIQAKKIAPTINFNQPNPYIDFADSPMYISDHLQDWIVDDGPRRAAISSFGFSHTNCHMVIEEAPEQVAGLQNENGYLFTLSAQKQSLLLNYITRYQKFCSNNDWNLADLCYTAAIGRGHYSHRLCIVAKDKNEFVKKLHECTTIVEGVSGESGGTYYGSHVVVSDKKKNRADGEIPGKQKRYWSDEAQLILENNRSTMDETSKVMLATLYCQGADIDWSVLYTDEKRLRLAQPTYPFERLRVWADPKITKVKNTMTRIHPLIDVQISASEAEWVYQSDFSCDTHWVLTDHKIKGTCVVPGTTYLEMARAVFCHAIGVDQLSLNDVFFLQPMVVKDNETRRTQCRLSRQSNHYEFTISSINDDIENDDWICHVDAKIHMLSDGDPLPQEIDGIKSAATSFENDYKIEADTGVFQFGPHWDAIRQTWTTAGQSMARLSLPSQLQNELNEFRIHPSILDNAMNLISQDGEATYLPFMYKSFKLFSGFTSEMYSVITAHNDVNDDAETHNYDVKLTNAEGTLIAEIEGYVTKKLHSFDFNDYASIDDMHLKRQWTPVSDQQASRKFTKSVLLISNGGRRAAALSDAWKQEGVDVRSVSLAAGNTTVPAFAPTPSGIQELIESEFTQGIGSIVFATDFDLSPSATDYLSSDVDFAERRTRSVDALFLLGKVMMSAKLKLTEGFVVLTSNSYSVNSAEASINPLGAATGMLGKTLALENPGLECIVLDVSDACTAEETVYGISKASSQLIIAMRSTQFYTQELCSIAPEDELPLTYHAKGVYIITGGLGGLGLRAAKHIAEKASANIVLLGRSAFPASSQWKHYANDPSDDKKSAICKELLSLQQQLASISYVQTDIADNSQLKAALSKIREEFGPIKGVFHAAGVAGDGFVINKAFDTYDAVLSPKLQGTRNLYEQIAEDNPEFLALYSSITAIIGGQGQGDYAAANAFMDAFVIAGTSKDMRVVSINWPSWEDVGMAVDYNIDHNHTPFTPILSADAMRSFDSLIAGNKNYLIPSTINATVFAQMLNSVPIDMSIDLARVLSRDQAIDSGIDGVAGEVQISGKSTDELSDIEVTLANIYASVLGINEIDIFTNFQDMGGNSIIATHLLKVIESHFPGAVDISDVFSYPSVDVMAEHISQDSDLHSTSETTNKGSDVNWADMMDKVVDGESIDKLLETV